MATIEIDGKEIKSENGKMIIEVADDAGIYIPRFCYHKKLSIAANCRMCLVEVENGRKPVPACATPITDGMKVYTKSEEAVHSQKAVMEFLLINHPLDCPICDQGGECELQDISMGFGHDQSDYTSSKRSVDDEDLGPLIETDMTRCIHCTRCVRFGDEIAGLRELGATSRGEHMEIGTYVKHSIVSEISGNVIDLCPVGALTSKPYRYTARAWELTQHEGIAPHDCLGSNVYLHVRRNKLMRVVPRENEAINETWLSDRDRFSYLGLNHEARASEPMIKRDGQWENVDWETALKFAVQGMQRVIKTHGPDNFAAFASPSFTLEEYYLLQKMMRENGVQNLDHRMQQSDFTDQENLATTPENSLAYANIEHQETLLLVGTNIHREVPLAGVRVRKAFLNKSLIYAVNPADYDFHFGLADQCIVAPNEIPVELARIAASLTEGKKEHLSDDIKKLLVGIEPTEKSKKMASDLCREKSAIVTGALCENHPSAGLIRSLLHLISELSGAKIVRLTNGANTAGAWLAGMIPHRSAAGRKVEKPGKDAQEALAQKMKGYLLLGVEPGYDFINPQLARQALLSAEFVVVLSAYENNAVQDYADVILPIAPYAETSGTYINVDQQWQTVTGVMTPHGQARPAWKVLRVLANLFECKGFDYTSSEEVLSEIQARVALMEAQKYQPDFNQALPEQQTTMTRLGEWPLYRCDAIVRHSNALQASAAADVPTIRVHPKTAERLKLEESATVSQGDIEITLPLKRDERMAPDVIWIANAMSETIDLGHAFAEITIKR